MEENRDFREFLESMEKTNRRQLRCARLQFVFSLLCALCCGAILLAGLRFLPQLQALGLQLETVLGNLERVTGQLAQTDLAGMVENVDALVTESGDSLQQAMENLNRIDFEKLSRAIDSLSQVVDSLSRITRIFG